MRRLLFFAMLCAACAAAPALAALQAGVRAPTFVAQASFQGKAFTYSLRNALKKGPVVVYFFPSAFTSGCDLEAHTFALNIDKFTRAGASIIGVSLDSIRRLNAFSADPNYCSGKFPTASDPHGRIAESYHVAVESSVPGATDVRGIQIRHGFAARTTFVVAPSGKIVASIGHATPVENVMKSLQAVRAFDSHR